MKPNTRNFALIVAAVALAGARLAVGAETADSAHGVVELLVRAPHGEPLANAEIQVIAHSEFFQNGATDREDVKTDAHGLAQFQWKEGPTALYVKAARVGYTSTGMFNLHAGQTVRVEIPRLIPFSVVEGTLAKELRVADAVVSLNTNEWLTGRATPDKTGHFVIPDAPCGGYWVHFKSAKNDALFGEAPVWAAPGQRVSVVIEASEPPRPIPYMPPTGPRGKGEKSLVWAEGTVRNQTGKPIEGAQVIAKAIYFGGMRMYSSVHSAVTDESGRWQIVGETDLSMFHGSLVAYKFGFPIVAASLGDPYSYGQGDDPNSKTKKPKNPTYDFVLPATSASLEVLVTRDNKPAADFAVTLSRENVPALETLNEWSAGVGGTYHDYGRLGRIVHPVAVTGTDGIARFDYLNPGTYTIEIDKWIDDRQHGRVEPKPTTYNRVPVNLGATRRFHAATYSNDFQLKVRLREPTGQPATLSQAMTERSSIASRYGTQSWTTLAPDGTCDERFREPGLWSLTYSYGVKQMTNQPQLFEPFYSASAVVAASPSLPADAEIALTAIKHEHKPGPLVVDLQDASGKPAFGYVCLDRFMLEPHFAGTTDENGEIRFAAVSGQMTDVPVEAYEPGLSLPDIGKPGDALPSDKELIGRTAIFSANVECPLDTESHLTIRPKAVGYVRGVVRPEPGMTAADYWAGCDYPRDVLPHVAMRYDEKTGQFLLGPFAEGSLELKLRCRGADKNWRDLAVKQVEVRGDKVAEVDWTAPALPPAKPEAKPAAGDVLQPPQYISIGLGGASVVGQLAKRVAGSVFLPDGRTPARDAEVLLFVPPSAQPVAAGRTNLDGSFSLTGTVRSVNAADQIEAQPAAEPTIVAWRPGQNGIAAVPMSRADAGGQLRLTLPPPLAMHGQVTVGGKPFSGHLGIVNVMAIYEGHGLTAALCGQEVSADADGNFELAGLTPGNYRLQATLDNIWLSPSARAKIAVDSGAQPAPIRLDISEPGKASTVNLVDKAGHGVPNMEVTVDRPEGPLAPLLWPHALFSDGAGCVHVPPLEAGEQKIRIAGAVERTFSVPRLTDQNTPAANLRVVVDASAK